MLEPLSGGAVHERDMLALPGVAVRPVGAPGTVLGVAVTVADALPVPAELTALIRNWYAVPFARPVTVADVVVLVPSEYVLHEPALAVLYCMV